MDFGGFFLKYPSTYIPSRLYSNDVAVLKDYGGIKYKLTIHKYLRNKGFEDEKKIKRGKGTVNNIVNYRQI